jgi:hypothetical protein
VSLALNALKPQSGKIMIRYGSSWLIILLVCSANAEPKCIADAVEEFAKDSEADILISWVSLIVSCITSRREADPCWRLVETL